jgi:xylulokinase
VNSSSDKLPATDNLDVMRLNWGPYLWMRCYTNGAQFLDYVVGKSPDRPRLEAAARTVPPGAEDTMVLPFLFAEPSLGVTEKRFRWMPSQPRDPAKKYRASLEALAYLVALGVKQHEKAGQKISRITVSGGIARSPLMCEILASVLNRRLERLRSEEGPALGAAVTALAALESHLRQKHGQPTPYQVSDAVAQMVKFREPVEPNPAWHKVYLKELRKFERLLKK